MKNMVVVVTDLGVFRAYRLERTDKNTPRLELFEEVASADAHSKVLDRVSDQAGRYHAPTNNKWGTPWGEKHNIELEQRKRLVRNLSEQLQKVLRQPGVDGCYLAASKEINHPITDALDAQLRAKIVKNIPADLTKLQKTELLERFGV